MIESKQSGFLRALALGIRDFTFLFLKTTSAHGFSHLVAQKRHTSERIIWLTSVLVGLYGAVWLSLTTWHRFQENPTVISVERNYKDWNTSMPALTICPLTKIDDSVLNTTITKWFPLEENMTVVAEWLNKLSNLSYWSLSEIVGDYLKPENYLQTVLDAKFNIQYEGSASTGEVVNLSDYVMTEMGICYTYNSIVWQYNSPNYWKDNKWPIFHDHKIIVGNPLEGDVLINLMNFNSGYKLYPHSPNDIAEISSKYHVSQKFELLSLGYSALSTVYSDSIKYLSISQRKCRMLEESNLSTSLVYSYKMCLVECRMKLAMKLCNCVPFFYRPTERLIKLRQGSVKEKCECLPTCDDVNYRPQNEYKSDWDIGTFLKYGISKYPRMRLKRDVFYGFIDLIVQLGGTAGLCLGVSVLSVCELIYFFTMRLVLFAIRRNRKIVLDHKKIKVKNECKTRGRERTSSSRKE